MSLSRYKATRNFRTTSEPAGGKSEAGKLIFVVQKHKASRLHYDFRLELNDVLLSWAVPKGPSTDPATKRLAVKVEDHPFDYRNFEGSIEPGNYGAGTVIIWDQGTYEPAENIPGKKAQEKHLQKQLKEGVLKIRLHGKKLKGEWALVRTTQSENSWLLIKHQDTYASQTDITAKTKSVVSGKTIEQLEKVRSPNAKAKTSSPKKTEPNKVSVKTKRPKASTAKKSGKKKVTG